MIAVSRQMFVYYKKNNKRVKKIKIQILPYIRVCVCMYAAAAKLYSRGYYLLLF